jgi:hypothetical protein
MVTDRQVRLLMELDGKGERPETSAAKAGMDGKTARMFGRLGKLSSHVRVPRLWRTRKDPFTEVFFPHAHHPGDLSESDFTCMSSLYMAINR